MASGLRVLLVEDDSTVAETCSRGLTLLGHEVTCVPTVAESVVTLCSVHTFQVVILDIGLSDGRGDSIIESVQRMNIPCPPVIVLSAYPEDIVEAAAAKIRTSRVLYKPVSLHYLDYILRQTVP